ncbi:hypothetical protein OAQ37_04135 [Alphaproteobacteria bacterium]|nr:hypothetical protein [Alphaproteobacteria bacterium]
MLNCCFCKFWKLIDGGHVAATNGYCHLNAPTAILLHQLSRKDLSKRDKAELGESAVPPRAFQPIPPDHKLFMELRAGKTSENQTLNSDQSLCIWSIFR